MKIIDIEKKGNAIRVLLGKDNLQDWYGDDWDNRDENSPVYDEFVIDHKDIVIPFKHSVHSPFDFYGQAERTTKEMMKNKAIPLLVIRYDEDKEGVYQDRAFDWESAVRLVERDGKKSKVTVIFMGDKFDENVFKTE